MINRYMRMKASQFTCRYKNTGQIPQGDKKSPLIPTPLSTTTLFNLNYVLSYCTVLPFHLKNAEIFFPRKTHTDTAHLFHYTPKSVHTKLSWGPGQQASKHHFHHLCDHYKSDQNTTLHPIKPQDKNSLIYCTAKRALCFPLSLPPPPPPSLLLSSNQQDLLPNFSSSQLLLPLFFLYIPPLTPISFLPNTVPSTAQGSSEA